MRVHEDRGRLAARRHPHGKRASGGADRVSFPFAPGATPEGSAAFACSKSSDLLN